MVEHREKGRLVGQSDGTTQAPGRHMQAALPVGQDSSVLVTSSPRPTESLSALALALSPTLGRPLQQR